MCVSHPLRGRPPPTSRTRYHLTVDNAVIVVRHRETCRVDDHGQDLWRRGSVVDVAVDVHVDVVARSGRPAPRRGDRAGRHSGRAAQPRGRRRAARRCRRARPRTRRHRSAATSCRALRGGSGRWPRTARGADPNTSWSRASWNMHRRARVALLVDRVTEPGDEAARRPGGRHDPGGDRVPPVVVGRDRRRDRRSPSCRKLAAVLGDAEEARTAAEQAGGERALDRLGRAEQRQPRRDRGRREAMVGERDQHRLEHGALTGASAAAWRPASRRARRT